MEVDEDPNVPLEAPPTNKDDATPSSHDGTAPPRRTADQVSVSAKAAGLTNSAGPIQLLHFSAPLNSDDIRLLEVPNDLLQALEQGER